VQKGSEKLKKRHYLAYYCTWSGFNVIFGRINFENFSVSLSLQRLTHGNSEGHKCSPILLLIQLEIKSIRCTLMRQAKAVTKFQNYSDDQHANISQKLNEILAFTYGQRGLKQTQTSLTHSLWSKSKPTSNTANLDSATLARLTTIEIKHSKTITDISGQF